MLTSPLTQLSAPPHRLHISALHLGHPLELLLGAQLKRGELLLDGGGGGVDARFSALCLHPTQELTFSVQDQESFYEQVEALERFVQPPQAGAMSGDDLDSTVCSSELPCPAPLTSCLLSYELGAPPRSAPDGEALASRLLRLPTLWAAHYEACYVWDEREARGWLISRHKRCADRAIERLNAAQSGSSSFAVEEAHEALTTSPLRPVWSEAEHALAIQEAQRLMREGEVYQVNLTCPLTTTLRAHVSPEEVYLRLRRSNPSPFGCFVRLDDERTILCQSPERLLRWSADGVVRTEPIKGTRPRGEREGDDQALKRELQESVKDRAEHTMIVDLERNDLGRVCVPGTVRVDALRALRTFPTVHHLVSVVQGQLRPEVGLAELITALFPGGSITGAPKRRAMEVIARLEPHPRGVYCGALGYLSADGAGDLNLPIRTCWLEGQDLTYHAGGGVVADSTAQGEWAELWVKARAISRGLEGLSAEPLEPEAEADR